MSIPNRIPAQAVHIPFSRRGAAACLSPVSLVRGGPRGQARQHFLPHCLPRPLPLTGYAPFSGYKGCLPSALVPRHRTLFGSRQRTSCRFSGQPALRDRSSRLPVHVLIRDYGTSLFVRGLPQAVLPASRALPATGRRVRQRQAICCWTRRQSSLPSPPGLRCTVAEVPKPFCRTPIRFEEPPSPSRFHGGTRRPDRQFTNWNAAVREQIRIYGAPKERLERLRAALSERLCILPESVIPTAGSTISPIWAAARPSVRTLRFRADRFRPCQSSIAARQPRAGRQRQFLDNVSTFASQSNILPEQDTPAHCRPRTRSRAERVEALRLRYRASTFAAWYAAGQCCWTPLQEAPGIEPRTLPPPTRHVPLTPRDSLSPNDPPAPQLPLYAARRRHARFPPRSRCPRMGNLIADMRFVRLLARLPGSGTAVETANSSGSLRRRPQTLGNLEKHCSGPAPRGRTTSALAALSARNGNLRRPRY